MVTLAVQAAQEIKKLIEKRNQPDLGLRISVREGCCSGPSYELNFDREKTGDNVFESEGVKLLVDPESYPLLAGARLELVDGLEGRSFKVVNPNAEKGGGCGCGESGAH